MELKDLIAFLNLCECKHFGRSAHIMHVSASTLSRQIQRLENHFGQALFIRDNRSVQLTSAGEEVRQFAKKFVQQHQYLCQQLSNEQKLHGKINIFCSVTAAYSHLPMILDQFRARYPLLDIALTTGDAADAVNRLKHHHVDLAIAGRPESLPDNIAFQKIDAISMTLIAPAQHYVINEQLNSTAPNWQYIPFILPEHGPSRDRINQWLKDLNIQQPTIYATVSGHEAIVSMVALGCGVSILPDVVVDNSPPSVSDRLLRYPVTIPKFDLGICSLKKKKQEAGISHFWQLATSLIHNHG